MVVLRVYDHELTLIGQKTDYDEIGNPIVVETKTTILCDLKSVGRTEFYNAAVNDMKPERVFLIHSFEYNKEELVDFDGERYSVLKTYRKGFEEMELTCEKDVGNG